MAPVKLYGLPFSGTTTRVMFCLNEMGVDFELVHVDLFSGEHKKPEFLTKNPFGKVPVLEDGDVTIFESRAINAYVAQKYKDKANLDLLHQDDLLESAQVKLWSEIEAHHYNPSIQPIVFQSFVGPLMGLPTKQDVIDAHLIDLAKVLDVYESRLADTKYLAGDFFSVVDINHMSYAHYFMTTKYANLVNDRPHVKAWWEDISSRPAFLKVAKDMKFVRNN